MTHYTITEGNARISEMMFVLILVYVFSDLINVFEVFLPQLLLYPNPTDPLNGEAATLLLRDKAKYEQSVRGNDNG